MKGRRKGLDDQLGSPAKRSTAAPMDAGLLRQLLAEQSAMLLSAQQMQLEMALDKQDQRYNQRFEKMESRMRGLTSALRASRRKSVPLQKKDGAGAVRNHLLPAGPSSLTSIATPRSSEVGREIPGERSF